MKETRATAAVQPIAPVPGFMPGTKPMKLLIKMKDVYKRQVEHCVRKGTDDLALMAHTRIVTVGILVTRAAVRKRRLAIHVLLPWLNRNRTGLRVIYAVSCVDIDAAHSVHKGLHAIKADLGIVGDFDIA